MNDECKRKYFSLCIIHYKQSSLLLSVCMCAHVHTHTHKHTHTHTPYPCHSSVQVSAPCNSHLETYTLSILWNNLGGEREINPVVLHDFLILVLPKVVALTVKNHPAMQETWVLSLGRGGMATHSSTIAWKIPWMEEPGRLQSMGLQRVRHDWATSLSFLLGRFPGKENGYPLQYSCLEDPRWAIVHGVTKSWT